MSLDDTRYQGESGMGRIRPSSASSRCRRDRQTFNLRRGHETAFNPLHSPDPLSQNTHRPGNAQPPGRWGACLIAYNETSPRAGLVGVRVRPAQCSRTAPAAIR